MKNDKCETCIGHSGTICDAYPNDVRCKRFQAELNRLLKASRKQLTTTRVTAALKWLADEIELGSWSRSASEIYFVVDELRERLNGLQGLNEQKQPTA